MTRREKKSVLACVFVFVGWPLLTFTVGDYYQWHNHLGILILLWILSIVLLINYVYQQGVKQLKEEQEKKEKIRKRKEKNRAYLKKIGFSSMKENDENK